MKLKILKFQFCIVKFDLISLMEFSTNYEIKNFKLSILYNQIEIDLIEIIKFLRKGIRRCEGGPISDLNCRGQFHSV